MSSFETRLPAALFPEQTTPICPLAEITHGTLTYAREVSYSKGADESLVKVSSSAIASILPRRSLLSRIIGANRLITPLTTIEEAHTTEECRDPVRQARLKAISEAIFQHLSSNCISCPYTETCTQRESLAQQAREIQYGNATAVNSPPPRRTP